MGVSAVTGGKKKCCMMTDDRLKVKKKLQIVILPCAEKFQSLSGKSGTVK